jgi:Asp-tRNA(Asn)/Glu-tRNA(Gln) amidotransferase A subunit family amidase
LAAGEPGLELIEQRYLANLDSANGDARHAMTALRFYHQYGRDIPQARLAAAMRHLLARPALAADAIADLARWEDWGSLRQVAGLFGQPGYDDPTTRRAIVGYLLACPTTEAAAELARLRRAALLMMEAGLAGLPAAELEGASARLQSMLDFARCKSAVHYAQADRALDAAVVATRRLFEQVDVLLLPTVPQPPPALGAEEPSHLADFCSFASLAGCPALTLPLPGYLGLSLVGPPGSDLRLLELGEVVAALIGGEQR